MLSATGGSVAPLFLQYSSLCASMAVAILGKYFQSLHLFLQAVYFQRSFISFLHCMSCGIAETAIDRLGACSRLFVA